VNTLEFLPQVVADCVRVFLIVGFVVLAITLPAAIRIHSTVERRTDSLLLAFAIWGVFVAGVLAVAHRFGDPLLLDLTIVRLFVVVVGSAYVLRNFRRRRWGRQDPARQALDSQQRPLEPTASNQVRIRSVVPVARSANRPCPFCAHPVGGHAPDVARPTGQKACSREGCPCTFTRDQLEDLR
jgi:hypothetical protein